MKIHGKVLLWEPHKVTLSVPCGEQVCNTYHPRFKLSCRSRSRANDYGEDTEGSDLLESVLKGGLRTFGQDGILAGALGWRSGNVLYDSAEDENLLSGI